MTDRAWPAPEKTPCLFGSSPPKGNHDPDSKYHGRALPAVAFYVKRVVLCVLLCVCLSRSTQGMCGSSVWLYVVVVQVSLLLRCQPLGNSNTVSSPVLLLMDVRAIGGLGHYE